MKYLTKDYYKLHDDYYTYYYTSSYKISKRAEIYSEKYFNYLYSKRNNEYPDRMNSLYNARLEKLKKGLPKEIIDKVADLRVMALNYISKEAMNEIKKYGKIYYEQLKKIENECHESQEKERKKINNDEIYYNMCLHDSLVIDLTKDGKDISMEIDNSAALTTVKKITFKDAKIIQDEGALNSWWLAEEIYKIQEGYEVHALLDYCEDEENQLRYFTIECKDIEYVYCEDTVTE